MSLPRIAAVARLLRERELARLAEATARARELRARLDALGAQVQSRATQLAGLVQQGEGMAPPADAGSGAARDVGAHMSGSETRSPVARSPEPGEPALAAGAEALWLRQLSLERERLQSALYAQMAEIEDLRAQAARAFGRSEVLGKLTEAERRARQQAREKRGGPG